jgi:GT2 family glycosyltransferase
MEGNDVKAGPTVYIILLNWHGWRDTIACLDSLASLEYTNYRVLVVDNGSTDDSVARIRAAHPEVPIIETGRNLGFSGGCNVGICRPERGHRLCLASE